MKQKKSIKLIISSSIIAILIVFIAIFVVAEFGIGYTKNGPYHHAAIVNYVKTAEFNDKNLYYADKLYEYNEQLNPITLYDNNDNEVLNVKDITANGSKLFVLNNNGNNIYVYDDKYNFIDNYQLSCLKIKASDSNLYYTQSIANGYKLYKFDISTKVTSVVADLINNSTIEDDNLCIYVTTRGDIHFLNSNLSYGLNFLPTFNKYSYPKASFSTIKNNWTICYENNTKSIVIENEKNKYSSNQLEQNVVINNDIFVTNDYVLFSTFDYIPNDKCNYASCICHYGKAKVWKFDFTSNSFEILNTYKTGTIITHLKDSEVYYYQDSNLYKNEVLLKNGQTIEPYGEFIIKGAETELKDSLFSINYFVLNDSDLYQIQSINKNIKDTYVN